MKKLFISTLIISLLFISGCGKEETPNNPEPTIPTEEQTKINTNDDVIGNKELEEFSFTNSSLSYENGSSTFETIVTNNSNNTTYLKEFKIIFKDNEGKEIVTLIGFVADNIGPNESKVITTSVDEDLTQATSIEYQVVR